MKLVFRIGCLFCVLTVFSCKKEESGRKPDVVFETGSDLRLNDIVLLQGNKWLVCGGHRDESGKVFYSEDNGNNWSSWSNDQASSIYCMAFSDSLNGICGGDYLHLWKTSDAGKTWTYHWLGDQVPFNEEDRPAVRNFYFQNDSTWFFCGGENLGEGVVYQTNDAGDSWDFRFFQHELRSIIHTNSDRIIVAGHGSMMSTTTGIDELQTLSFSNDFITSMATTVSGRLIAVSFSGSVYTSNDNGANWKKIEKGNRPFVAYQNWNDVIAIGEKVVAVGTRGSIAESNDGGNTWSFDFLENEPDLFSVVEFNGSYLATSDKGKVYKFSTQ